MKKIEFTKLLRGAVTFWDSRAGRGIVKAEDGQEFYITKTSLLDKAFRPQLGGVVLFKRCFRVPQAAVQVLEAA